MIPTLRCRTLLAALLLTAGLTAGTAGADVVQLRPTQDGTLYENANGEFASGSGPTIFAGRTAIGFEDIRRALLKFDLAGNIPAGSTVNSVTLRLYMSRTISSDYACTLHPVTTAWGEGASNAGVNGGSGATALANDATWLHSFYSGSLWSTAGGDFAAVASASTLVGLDNGFYTWGTTPALVADAQNMLDNAASNHGWLLKGDESTTATAKRFDSRESSTTTADTRPLLTVEYTPHVIPVEESTWSRIKGLYR